MRRLLLLSFFLVLPLTAQTDWPVYGHDPGAQRYSPLTQITPKNVGQLRLAWKVPLVAKTDAGASTNSFRRFAETSEITPLVVDGLMYVVTPDSRALALSPDTGQVVWSYKNERAGHAGQRSIAYWPGDGSSPPELLYGTIHGYLVALNAKTGKPIAGFADHGILNLRTGLEDIEKFPHSRYSLASPPAIYRDLVITGSAVQEQPSLGPYGDVRAWNVKTGRLVWTFHSVPRPGEPGHDTWADNSWRNRSGTNVWGLITVDTQRGIVYLPFGCSTYDYVGVDRKGANLYGDTLTALDAATGKLKWYFQTTHHDLWDYDDNSPPVLFTVKRGGRDIPAVGQMTKEGLFFILNRVTGKPIYGVAEKPVPQDGFAPGEHPWPTQPFPMKPAPLARNTFSPADLAKVTPKHAAFCRQLLASNGGLRTGGPYLPASKAGSVVFPGTLGGSNWGGGAFDPKLGYFIVNIQNLGEVYQLYQRSGGSWAVRRHNFWDPRNLWPCVKPPWGQLVAVNVNNGNIAWKAPLGEFDALTKLDIQNTGTPNIGGPMITASGLVFVGATVDGRFRAFDANTGKQLWVSDLGAAAHSIPMTYLGANGKQYVAVVASGGGYLTDHAIPAKLMVYALSSANSKIEGRLSASAEPKPTPPTSAGSQSLPPGTGRALVESVCTQCHGMGLITAQHKSRKQWDETIGTMISRGATATDDQFESIAEYLARNFGPVTNPKGVDARGVSGKR